MHFLSWKFLHHSFRCPKTSKGLWHHAKMYRCLLVSGNFYYTLFFFWVGGEGGDQTSTNIWKASFCKSSQWEKVGFENPLPLAPHLSHICLFCMCSWSVILSFILLVIFLVYSNLIFFPIVCSLEKLFAAFLVMTSIFLLWLGQGSYSISTDIKESLPSIWLCYDFSAHGSTQRSYKRIW